MNHYFWDSCVFIAYLNDEPAYDITSLDKFINEMKGNPGCRIYTSSIIFAEATPGRLLKSGHETFESFCNDFRSSVRIVDSSSRVNSRAGRLKDVTYKKGASTKRVLTTGDAIMLASALELEDVFGIRLDAFHTYDDGRGSGHPEGKGVPLLSYDEWLEGVDIEGDVKRVVDLNRCLPIHDAPELPLE